MARLGYRRFLKGHLTVLHAVDTIRRIRADDKLDWDDAPRIGSFIAGEAIMWGSDLLDWRKAPMKPLYIIDAAIITGGVVSYAIAGEEGVYDYVDLISGEVSPTEFAEVVIPAIQSEVTEPIIDYVVEEIWEKQLVDPITGWVSRREDELIAGAKHFKKEFKSRWMNPVHRLF